MCYFIVISIKKSHEISRPVPVIPSWITGRCVYGHIITEENRDSFRRLYPNVNPGQSSNPDALVSAASLINFKGGLTAATTRVYHEGQWHVCLIHVDNWLFYPEKIADRRRSGKFMAAIHKTLGITGEPQWYPCYIP